MGIRAFFLALLNPFRQDIEMKGCLLVNTLPETPAEDEEINRRVSDLMKQMENDFRQVLQQARSMGDLDGDRDTAALARMLITGIFGLRVYNRLHHDSGALQSIVDELLSTLNA